MIKSYIRIAIRNLIKNKLYTIINVLGLAAAIGWCILGYVNYEYSQSYDSFHENSENIYRINSRIITGGNSMKYGMVPFALPSAARNDISGIEEFVRITRAGGIVRHGESVFNESFYFIDEKFFNMFNFPAVMGNSDIFSEKQRIIITERISEKYFGDLDPVGKILEITFSEELTESFAVQGVVENPPKNSSIRFNILMPMDKFKILNNLNESSWKRWIYGQFFQLSEGTSPKNIEDQLSSYIKIQNDSNPDRKIESFYLDPLKEIANNSRDLPGNLLWSGMHPAAIIGPTVMSFLTLLLACFNYMNTAIAYSARRLKEIGIRKVVGCRKGQLVKQFLGENFLLCTLALIAGLYLATHFVPYYDGLWPELDLKLDYFSNFNIIFFIIGLLIFTSLVAGGYPSFYIAKFDPVKILRGKQKLGKNNFLIKTLLVFQFSITMMSIIMTIVFAQNSVFQKNFDFGFEKDRIINIPVYNENIHNVFSSRIRNHNGIESMGSTRWIVGRSWTRREAEVETKKTRLGLMFVGENYLNTMKMDMTEGDKFDWNLNAEADNSILVNEEFTRVYGWNKPVGKIIKVENREYRVSGVMKDFYFRGFWGDLEPFAILKSKKENYRNIAVRFKEGMRAEVFAYIEKTWKETYPNLPFEGNFHDEISGEAMRVTDSIISAAVFNTITSLMIACMGLFALVSLNIAKKTKELGVRKILGATMFDTGRLISKEFIILILIGAVFASVSGYYSVQMLISSIYTQYVGFSFLPFVSACLIMITTAVITVCTHVVKAARTNPVNALRYE